MQSAILLSFVTSSSLPPCKLQFTHSWVRCYISPYVVYNVYGEQADIGTNKYESIIFQPRKVKTRKGLPDSFLYTYP